jgi:hypothetical protein
LFQGNREKTREGLKGKKENRSFRTGSLKAMDIKD